MRDKKRNKKKKNPGADGDGGFIPRREIIIRDAARREIYKRFVDIARNVGYTGYECVLVVVTRDVTVDINARFVEPIIHLERRTSRDERARRFDRHPPSLLASSSSSSSSAPKFIVEVS